MIRRLAVWQLVRSGHQARGLARSAENARALRELVAEPLHGELWDEGIPRDAVRGARWVR